jgi:hypothetical protein
MRLAKMWEMKRPLDPAEDPAEFELFLDVFNVLNTINYTDIVGVTSSSRFGLPSLAGKGPSAPIGILVQLLTRRDKTSSGEEKMAESAVRTAMEWPSGDAPDSAWLPGSVGTLHLAR